MHELKLHSYQEALHFIHYFFNVSMYLFFRWFSFVGSLVGKKSNHSSSTCTCNNERVNLSRDGWAGRGAGEMLIIVS